MISHPDTLDVGALVIVPGAQGALFTLAHRTRPDNVLAVGGPAFHVGGRLRDGFAFESVAGERPLPRGGREVMLRYAATGDPPLDLRVDLRAYPGSPLLRMRYRLTARAPVALTRPGGVDHVRYLTLARDALSGADLTEVQLSHFDPVAHSYKPNVERHASGELIEGLRLAGPIAVLTQGASSALAAYEHGADHPLRFLEFRVESDGLTIAAARANHYDGQPIGPEAFFESVWLQLGLAPLDGGALLERYRAFVLDEMCESVESRRPYVFYNTWNYQERRKYFHGRPYLESMTYERMTAEIDVAHRLGVDVFVIDTGWYGKTGDWEVNLGRFPDRLQEIKRRLDGYGMKLGLWFNPTVAALTSRVFREHPEWEMTRGGRAAGRGPVWETEESTGMCLVSGYADTFVETMVRLHHELGVSYFKWDAVQQYGCDSPRHDHGTEANSPEERAECYAYAMGRAMIRIVEDVARRCPDVIVDFDITEGGRFVGLGFLSAGKYFLVNNGPYFHDFDIPRSVTIEPDTINVFFYPGAARPRVCRTGALFDPVVPSVLFLTHYLPDPPALAQRNSLASLVLGGGGIWGDLLALTEEDVGRLAAGVADYKLVAEAAARAFPRVRGFAGASPEVHEKIDPASASGLVALFTVAPGEFVHLTRPIDASRLAEVRGADSWEVMPDGRLRLVVALGRDDARVVYVVGRP